jgi:hypothetical protein
VIGRNGTIGMCSVMCVRVGSSSMSDVVREYHLCHEQCRQRILGVMRSIGLLISSRILCLGEVLVSLVMLNLYVVWI